jgi:[ribosomal protein S5]-alanine N-acetyltransferase
MPRGMFEELLGADVASPWPPPLNDDDSRRWMIRYLETNPEPGWGLWYFLLKREAGERPVAIGNGGYKGPPSRDGTVEIGYSVVPAYQGRGLAAEAIAAFVARAFGDARVQRVIAETMPDNIPSLRVLERNGFLRSGPGSDPGSIRLQRDR